MNDTIVKARCTNLFRDGVEVYIDRTTEEVKPHLHTHDFIEIAYVASGRGVHKIANCVYPVSKGDLFIINYDVAHEFCYLYDVPKAPLIVYNCIFTPKFIDSSLVDSRDFYDLTQLFLFKSLFPEQSKSEENIKLLEKDTRQIEEIYEKMVTEYQTQEKGYAEVIRAHIIELLIKVFRLYDKETSLKKCVETKRKEIIYNTIRYIKENALEDIKLKDIAAHTFLSANYLSKLFKEYTGITISGYIQKTRIDKACERLKSTDQTILQIASEVGYSDIKHFNQIFKRIVGKTPSEYRRS